MDFCWCQGPEAGQYAEWPHHRLAAVDTEAEVEDVHDLGLPRWQVLDQEHIGRSRESKASLRCSEGGDYARR